MERLLSLCYRATVGNDNAVRLDGMVIDIPPGPKARSYACQRVEVRQLLDGRWRVYFQHQAIAEAPATEPVELIRAKRKRKGLPGAYDAVYVNLASAPLRPPSPPAADTRAAPPTCTARRARPRDRNYAYRLTRHFRWAVSTTYCLGNNSAQGSSRPRALLMVLLKEAAMLSKTV